MELGIQGRAVKLIPSGRFDLPGPGARLRFSYKFPTNPCHISKREINVNLIAFDRYGARAARKYTVACDIRESRFNYTLL